MQPRPHRFGRDLVLLALVLLALTPSLTHAQYMYLDSNGDGVHSSADVIHGIGPTVVDVWLDTGHNRDGTATICSANPAQPVTLFSYLINMNAAAGTVSFSSYTNRIVQMFQLQPGSANATHLTTPAFATPPGTFLPPGKYRLGTFNLSVVSGTPSLQITTDADINLATSFGSNCDANVFGNTMVLGLDWFDVDGLAYDSGGGPNQSPVLSPIGNLTVTAGENATQPITANDADGQPLTFSKDSGPSFLFVYTTSPGDGSAQGKIHLAPLASDVGSTPATVAVTDGSASSKETFNVTVSPGLNHLPNLTPAAKLSVIAGRIAKALLEAGDPDGSVVHIMKRSGPSYLEVRELKAGAGGTTAVLTLSPTECDVGSTSALVAATDGVADAQRQVDLEVVAASAPPDSSLRSSVYPGPYPGVVALGDLNGDGKLDLVKTHQGPEPPTISVLLGRGDGTFDPPAEYSMGKPSFGLIIADLNSDGRLDVAASNSFDGSSVSVFLGRGDGTLTPQTSYATGVGPQGIAAADMNHDGILDLVTGNEAGSVSVLLGRGDGSFNPSQDSPFVSGPRSLVVSDFNLDGRPDVVVAQATGGSTSALLTFLPGLGDGNFGTPVPATITGYSLSIATGDWNWDGNPDVATSDLRFGRLVVFIGRGDGTFDPHPAGASFGYPWGTAAADLNGDGNTDLATADLDFNRVVVFLNEGNGSFASPIFRTGLGAAGFIALGDVNSDGRPDIVDNIVFAALNRFTPGAPAVEARAFVRADRRAIPVSRGAGDLIVRLEPVGASYTNDQLDRGSFVLRSEGTGSVSEIHCTTAKRIIEADTDQNGIAETEVTFARRDLAALFDQIHGHLSTTAELTAALTNGRAFCTGVGLEILGTGGAAQAALFSPNPLNPSSKLRFTTVREGPASAHLFDIHGRLVRTLLATQRLPAGEHEYSFDGKSDQGKQLASGVYFYRVASTEGESGGQIVILK